MWSAAVDPRVLAVRAEPAAGATERLFDLATTDARLLCGRHTEHLLIARGAELFRLDVIASTSVTGGPVSLRFDIADNGKLPTQISVMARYTAQVAHVRRHGQLGNRLLALAAVDTRDAGASLRETADAVLGPGHWPGDGDHRKSMVRRMLVAGDRMIRAGPSATLVDRANDP